MPTKHNNINHVMISPKKLLALNWQAARHLVQDKQPKLANIIDQINPGSEYKLYQVNYDYGNEILKDGLLQLPNEHGKLSLITDHESFPQQLYADLSYNQCSNPVTLTLSNSIELFINLENRIVPYVVIPQGTLFGLWRLLDPAISHCPPTFCWGMTAGARSLFMLPKISDTLSHKKIQSQLNINIDKPASLFDHGKLFKAINQQQSQQEPWQCQLLLFSKAWFEKLNDPAWQAFKMYLLEQAWQSSQFWRNHYILPLSLTRFQTNQQRKPQPFIDDMINHLIAIAVGGLPGFAPAINDQDAPIELIKQTYKDIYQLKHYPPIIMTPTRFQLYSTESRPCYFSLQYPTALEMAPRTTSRLSAINDLEQIQTALYDYISDIKQGRYSLSQTPFEDQANHVNYDFFHNQSTQHALIKHSSLAFEQDPYLKSQISSTKQAPIDASFFRGCIRIMRR